MNFEDVLPLMAIVSSSADCRKKGKTLTDKFEKPLQTNESTHDLLRKIRYQVRQQERMSEKAIGNFFFF